LYNAYNDKVKNQKELVDELIELRVRVGQQRTQLGQLDEENKKLKVLSDEAVSPGQLTKLTQELARLEDENQKLRAAPIPAPAGQESLAEELRQIREELGRSETENKKLRAAIVTMPAHDQALAEEVRLLKVSLAELKDENFKLRQNPLAQHQEGYDKGLATSLQRELDKTRKDYISLQIRCEQLEKENIQLKQTTALLQDQELLNKEAAAVREKLTKVELERDRLRVEVAQARKQDGFVEGLKEGHKKEVEKLYTDLEGIRDENRKLSEEAIRLRKFESSTRDMDEARRQIVKLSDEKQAVAAELDALKAKQDALVDQLVKVRREKDSLEESNRGKVVGQIERLQQDLKDAQAFTFQLVQEKAGFETKTRQLNNQIKMLESQLSQMEKTVAELNSKDDILKTEHAKLSDQLAQTMVKLSESDKEKQAITLQADMTKREITDLRAQLVQAQDIASKMKDEMYQLRKSNEDLIGQNEKIVGQRAQEVAIANAQIEQLRAHKDGEISALNQKFAKLMAAKEVEVVSVSEKFAKMQQDLQNAQTVSLQLMQEKTGFGGQQKQLADEYKRLENQNAVMAGQIKKLEDQNAFLQNQFITVSQESDTFKRIAKGGKKGSMPEKRYVEELQEIKKELLRKSQQLRLYEQSGGQGLSKQNKALIDDYARLKRQYDSLTAKNKDLEEIKKQYEDFKSRSGKLPDENAMLHYNLSVLYAQNQEYTKAIAELEKVVELKPNDGEAYYNLGVIYGEYLNSRKKAIGYFKKYLALSPKDADADRIRKYVLTYETFDQ
jgi:chromosome segregation ATPase